LITPLKRVKYKKKGHKNMKNQSGLAKSIVGLVVAILVIVGGLYGLNIDIELPQDAQCPETEMESVEAPAPEAENADTSVEVVETEAPSNDSAQLEEQTQAVDESVVENVTPPADNTENVVTEGE
jgi:hypothetical protein